MTLFSLLPKFKLSRSFIIYFIVAQIVILFSNHQFFQEIWATPPGKLNLMVHRDWPMDYFGLVSFVTQGAGGAWLRYSSYATEPNKPGIFYVYYLLTGKAGAFFALAPQYSYHIAQFAATELFVIGLYALSKQFLGRTYGTLGAYFGLLATVGPEPLLHQPIQVTWYPQGYPWWENLDSLERLYMPAHHVFGQALMLWALYFLLRWIARPSVRLLLAYIVTFLVGSITFPVLVIPFGIASVPAYVFFILRNYLIKKKIEIQPKLLIAVIITMLLFGFIYILQMYHDSLGYPWSYTKINEIARWNHEPSFDIAMPYIFGVLPLMALPALISILILGSWQEIFIVIWAAIPYALLPFADILQFPKIRLVHENPYVPFAFLSVITVTMAGRLGGSVGKYLQKILVVAFFVSVIPVSLYHLYYRYISVDYFLKNGDTRQFYISQDVYDSFAFFWSVPRKSYILADSVTGVMIPAFAPIVSFVGHQEAIDYWNKQFLSNKFYDVHMSDEEAAQMIKNYNISYVYFGPYEKAHGHRKLSYPFLKEVYRKGEVIIYKVVK